MLTLQEIGVRAGGGTEAVSLLQGISLHFPPHHFGAIIGPSGCGKSTLLKCIGGLHEHETGLIHWRGREVGVEHDLDPAELGYVPQFSIFHDELSVDEIVRNAFQLRRSGDRGGIAREVCQEVLDRTGLAEIAGRRAKFLSGGQRRRLGLAMELVSNPALLLADEVTSGLDPKSEDTIVGMLRNLADESPRIVLSVTHSLRHLALYDSVTVLYEGRQAFHGPSSQLLDYFAVSSPDEIFPRLMEQSPEEWAAASREQAESWSGQIPEVEDAPAAPGQAGWMQQFVVLFFRRWKLFFRERGQVALHFLLLFLFPCLVVLFAYQGLPEIRNMSLAVESNMLKILAEKLEFSVQLSKVGSLVSGLVMFQVILLALMGANNGAREVASERLILEKEKLSGMRLTACLAAKALFLAVLVLAQSAWMTFFVKEICRLPGDILPQLVLLTLVNAAMTTTCLCISAWSRSAEQASLVSVYLVGFQLPLSGAVLALPEPLGMLIRPLIPAYWSWSGYLQTLRETRFYDLVSAITSTPLANLDLSLWILGVHVAAGLMLAVAGMSRGVWDRGHPG